LKCAVTLLNEASSAIDSFVTGGGLGFLKCAVTLLKEASSALDAGEDSALYLSKAYLTLAAITASIS
jgi:hypothetical protein